MEERFRNVCPFGWFQVSERKEHVVCSDEGPAVPYSYQTEERGGEDGYRGKQRDQEESLVVILLMGH